MPSFFERNPWLRHLSGLLILTVMIIVVIAIKEKDIAKTSGAQKLEATYHALLTRDSLRQNETLDH